MEREKLWAKTIAAIIITLILTVGGCNIHLDYRISKAIDAGADPVVVRAAFDSGGATTEVVVYEAVKALSVKGGNHDKD